MGPNPDKIYVLTLKEIAGTISQEDKQYLYRVIADDEEAFLRWQSLHQKLGHQQLLRARESMQQHSTRDIINAANRRRKTFNTRVLSTISVILLAFGSLYVFFIKHQPSLVAGVAANAAFNSKQLQLGLASGKIVDLTAYTSPIDIDGITYTPTRDTLRFTANRRIMRKDTLRVPYGRDYTIVLGDGTKIQLNAGSQLIFPVQFTGSTREVAITGEAYLEVSPNTLKPFFVTLPDGNRVQVLGTAFNVNTYDSTVRVTLLNGAVKVQQGKTVVSLKQPGNEAVSSPGRQLYFTTVDTQLVFSWRKGIYKFKGTSTLRDVFNIIPRWYGVEVEVKNTAILQKPFSGRIDRRQPLGSFLDDLHTLDSSFQFDYDDAQKILHII